MLKREIPVVGNRDLEVGRGIESADGRKRRKHKTLRWRERRGKRADKSPQRIAERTRRRTQIQSRLPGRLHRARVQTRADRRGIVEHSHSAADRGLSVPAHIVGSARSRRKIEEASGNSILRKTSVAREQFPGERIRKHGGMHACLVTADVELLDPVPLVVPREVRLIPHAKIQRQPAGSVKIVLDIQPGKVIERIQVLADALRERAQFACQEIRNRSPCKHTREIIAAGLHKVEMNGGL